MRKASSLKTVCRATTSFCEGRPIFCWIILQSEMSATISCEVVSYLSGLTDMATVLVLIFWSEEGIVT